MSNIKHISITVTYADGDQSVFNLDHVKQFQIETQVLQETEESVATRVEFIPDSDPHIPQKHPGPLRYIKIAAEVAS